MNRKNTQHTTHCSISTHARQTSLNSGCSTVHTMEPVRQIVKARFIDVRKFRELLVRLFTEAGWEAKMVRE